MIKNSLSRLAAGILVTAVFATCIPMPVMAQTSGSGFYLPWKNGISHVVSQSWASNGTHACPGSDCYSYDFNLADGEEVRAAAAGKVVHVRGDSKSCGGKEQINNANFVVLDHADGSSTLYYHLKTAAVSLGQQVTAGQKIGTAGNTGWTNCATHLHFQRQVKSSASYYTNSQPIYFAEYPSQQLIQGKSYTSQNSGSAGSNAGSGSGSSSNTNVAGSTVVAGCGSQDIQVSGKVLKGANIVCHAKNTMVVQNSEVNNSNVQFTAGTRLTLKTSTKVHTIGAGKSFRVRTV